MTNDILTPKKRNAGTATEKDHARIKASSILTPKKKPENDEPNVTKLEENAEKKEKPQEKKKKFGTMDLVSEEKRISVIDGLIAPVSSFEAEDVEKLDKKFAEKEKEFWRKKERRML